MQYDGILGILLYWQAANERRLTMAMVGDGSLIRKLKLFFRIPVRNILSLSLMIRPWPTKRWLIQMCSLVEPEALRKIFSGFKCFWLINLLNFC